MAGRRPARAALVVGVIVAGATVAGFAFGSLLLGVLAGLLLLGSIADYLLPIRYSLDGEGATARALWHQRHLSWSEVRRVIRDDLGVKLSPLARPSRLDSYRGIYLWFSDNEADVMATIAHHTTAEAAPESPRAQ